MMPRPARVGVLAACAAPVCGRAGHLGFGAQRPPCGRPLTMSPPTQSCWNCGRKASETCSGCNAARYCGSFCQHRDWEKHHHVCGQSLQGPAAAVADPGPAQPDAAAGLGPCLPAGAASPSEASSAGPSRPGSPGPPGPLDAAPR